MGRLTTPTASMLSSLDDWLNYQEQLHTKAIDLGLERVQTVYQTLFPRGVSFKVISVAGTNGKGSTIAFIDSIYQQTEHKVAKFTSPHILQYNERFSIDGVQIDDKTICSAFEKIEQARGDISLTYFEFSTLAALVIFNNKKVDIALLEVGLGGRLDSVNVVDNDVALITNIALEHTDYLGDTREKIGFEKAGIMRKNIPCICADLDPPSTIYRYAKKIGAPLSFVNTPYLGAIALSGTHQKINAALAIQAVNTLQSVLPVEQSQCAKGIENTKLTARLQITTIQQKTIILDVAHNLAAVQVLANELEKDKCPSVAIFSAFKDKDIASMINIMESIVNDWLLVPINTNRAIAMQDLVQKFSLSSRIKVCENMHLAIYQALNNKQIERIVIFGSFYVIADALKTLKSYSLNKKSM